MSEKNYDAVLKELEQLKKENDALRRNVFNEKKIIKVDFSNTFFSIILENASVGIVLFNEDGRISKVNPFLLNMLGYTEQELYDLKWEAITHPDDVASLSKEFDDLLNGKKSYLKFEKRCVSKAGQTKNTRIIISIIRDEKNPLHYYLGIIEDITPQKKLAKEERLFNILMDNIPDKIYFKDLNSKFVKVSRSKAIKSGFKNPEDMVGLSDFDIFGKEHSQQAFADEQLIIKTGEPKINIEEMEDWLDGRVTWASTTKLPLYDANGKIIGTFGITRDITERKEMDKALHESEERYRKLFQTSADGMFLMTDVIVECNDASCKILNYERENLLRHSLVEFCPEFQEEGRKSADSFEDYLALVKEGENQSFYWKFKTSDGRIIDTEVFLNLILSDGKKIIQAIFRDITERSRYEKVREALFEISEAAYNVNDMDSLYRQIHHTISKLMPAKNFYIAFYDEKENLLSFPYYVNEKDPPITSKKFGRGLTEYVLRTGEEILVNAEKDIELQRKGEIEMVDAPQTIWLGVPLKISGKTVGVIALQNYKDEKVYGEEELLILTFVSDQVVQAIERRKNAEEIKRYAEELKQLNATKDKFFSIIAHDLKNPFITILGFSDLLITDYDELTDEEILYYVQEMKSSADKSHSLLQNLLQWSRSQTGHIHYNPRKLNLREIACTNANLVQPAAQKKNIALDCSLNENIFVNADEDMLNTIFRNLLTNAVKFTDLGGSIKINSKSIEGFEEVTIEDNGIGMPEDIRLNLFRLDKSYTTTGTQNETGTGLGLILCKEFVEKQGGSIKVESEESKGTKFIFTLPLYE
ncbi:MAG: PAS domain S-box protein [Bacteroidota bacterium]